jgi:flagellar basal body-associated protein FliL
MLDKRVIALLIVLLVTAAAIGTVAYYALRPGQPYRSLITYQWEPPPNTNTTAPFTTNGKQWYVEWTFVSYYLVSSTLTVSVRDATTNALVDQANLTSQQRIHYFNEQGRFYLSIELNNATNLQGTQLVIVNVSEQT